MFAARANQENAIHQPQNIKSLAPKTPSGKTPFRGAGKKDGDENALQLPGKAGAGGKPDRNAFVTPANPRTRAPLGNKTTNVKAAALQPTVTKPPPTNSATKPRRAHPKIIVHASTTVPAEENVLEREIEYMPPREVPMRDHELDDEIFPHDRDLSYLQGKNLTRGWWAEYAPEPKEDDGELSDFGEKLKKAEKKRKEAAMGSVKARSAVGALSKRTTTATPVGSVAGRERKPLAGMTAARERKTSTTALGKPSSMRGGPAPGNPRFTAARVASNSTIGYSKGRVVSRPRLPSMAKPEERKTTLDDLLTGFGDLNVDDAEAEALGLGGHNGEEIQDENEEGEVFQLEALSEDV
ncbi:uncharacterized protein RCC_04106 [Ramularia collo-cygni]|uniref:Uncharacterized protein n=1 Tax=Ramularia collo-cygni TaxID=112498 RepID=A0A2D3UQX6_9PEZI|nr:uncharacterized protein RCC_04106 [Ramularia collo-cygni]CZT18261.1 uncharacterized protein RCC_04106 [Ramularia collo-cygni]